MRKSIIWLLFLGVGFLSSSLVLLSNLPNARAQQAEEGKQEQGPTKQEWEYLFPEGEGKSYILALCQTCHTLRNVALRRDDEFGWQGVLSQMSFSGASLFEEDMQIMSAYLTENFGREKPPLVIPLDLNKASMEQLALFPQLTKEEAAKILELAKTKGIKDIADLSRVLTEERIKKIKPFITVR